MKMNATEISTTGGQALIGPASMGSTFENTFTAYRLSYSAASAALIGSVFVIGTAPLGAVLVLPLIGIYTGLCVVLGRSPLATVIDAHTAVPYVVPPMTEAVAAQRTEKSTAASRAA